MNIRSKAPLRLGIAGGGTDVSPYSDTYGGCVLNASINMYSYTFIKNAEPNSVEFSAEDIEVFDRQSLEDPISIKGALPLHRATFKKVMDLYNDGKNISLKISTFSDAPPGSGLGSSSTMVVSMLAAYRELLSLPLGDYDIAKLAYEIERIDCGLAGGKQDQYAAAFGGFNFMEFYNDDRVVVNPLRIKNKIKNELEASMILFFTGASRSSAAIIDDQVTGMRSNKIDTIEGLHEIKNSSYKIKEFLLKGDIQKVASELKLSWEAKKKTSKSISNKLIESIELVLKEAGAISWKVSGAGGGGFIMIFVNPEDKRKIENKLKSLDGSIKRFEFINYGCKSWKA
jgi:D-glycero-alpha-D-manno-heptose-7-phosphate kinase